MAHGSDSSNPTRKFPRIDIHSIRLKAIAHVKCATQHAGFCMLQASRIVFTAILAQKKAIQSNCRSAPTSFSIQSQVVQGLFRPFLYAKIAVRSLLALPLHNCSASVFGNAPILAPARSKPSLYAKIAVQAVAPIQ